MSVNTKVNGELVKSAGLYSVTKPIGMADIYSTEEKEVGVWTDGKPLYSKTVTATSNVATSDGSWADISGAMSPTISNAETLVDAQIHGTVNIDYSMLRFCIVDGVIKCASKVSGNGWYTGLKVTFFYTKTTDTPWSGKFVPQGYGYVSSGDIYSFEERRIGVYADGKPLYQKTVDFGALPNNTTKQVAHNVANLDKIAYVNGIINYSGLIYGEDMPPVILNKSFRTAVRENVVEISTTDNLSSYGAIVTFQYTKTTDVAGGESIPSGGGGTDLITTLAEMGITATFVGDYSEMYNDFNHIVRLKDETMNGQGLYFTNNQHFGGVDLPLTLAVRARKGMIQMGYGTGTLPTMITEGTGRTQFRNIPAGGFDTITIPYGSVGFIGKYFVSEDANKECVFEIGF